MCGISGIVHTNGQAVETHHLETCTNALKHRGPDASGSYIRANVGLGHRRLSVIDLTVAANQPFYSPKKKVALVFNGEIYNFKELRAELTSLGHTFTTNGDTEVLLHTYLEYGRACVTKLRGMFAFAIHDTEQNHIFLARDRTGQKPLHYFYNNGTFAFASELQALHTLPMCPRTLNEQELYDFLTFMYIPAPATGFTSIFKLPAAHTATLNLDTNTLTTERYWSLPYTVNTKRSVSDWKDSTLELLKEATKLRTIADVPLGAFLSGGIDSGVIVALLAEQSSKPIQTFSIGSDDKKYNELPEAAQVAARYQTDHTEIALKPDVVTLLPELVRAYNMPFADPSVLPTYQLCKQTSQKVTVALSGDGGDENFAGYARYSIAKFARLYKPLSCVIHPIMRPTTAALQAIKPTTFTYRCARFQASMGLPKRQRYLQYLSFFTEAEKQSIWLNSMKRTDERYAKIVANNSPSGLTALQADMQADACTYLPEDLLPKVDIASMAFGLEVRAPFLDHKLLEHSATMPDHYKLRGFTRKWILKELASSYLPNNIVHGKKRGFRLPLNNWFREHLREFVQDSLLTTNAPIHRFCQKAGLEQFLKQYYQTNIDYSDHVWSLLWLNEWLTMHTYDS